MADTYSWWQRGIIYQVYPRSFMDANRDGVGDLAGISSKLDYFKQLSIDGIWISPFYPSPMADFGYDVADFTNVDPLFGTLVDFDHLIREAHARGMKIILDLVPNHSSDRHPWFIESRSSPASAKRDWYIWRDPAPGGGPPNNWLSVFGGSAWEWDEHTGQYYYHAFLKEQPDLNWRNSQVRNAIYDAMRFWLDRGVDGFRVDAVWFLYEDPLLRDNPPNPDYKAGDDPYEALTRVHTEDLPEMHETIREMRQVADEYDGPVLIGELYLPLPQLMKYYGENLDECHIAYNFRLILLPWDPELIREAVREYEAALPPGAWPNWVLGNHDKHRIATRAGQAQARVAQMMLLTLRGMPTCYYGDEIGMADVDIPQERVQDPAGLNTPGLGLGRDPERTPMQWDSTPYAGFSTVEPWLPVAANYPEVNVAAQWNDPTSMLTLFRSLITLRKDTPALAVGSYAQVDAGHPDIFAYIREHESTRIVVMLNFSNQTHSINLGALGGECRILLSTMLDRSGMASLISLKIRPNEGLIADIS
ncbi:MAG TPA: alpha-amylase family glycosyl hydrolase [Chloroflexia bacterium]|nr:alpha-amylase family glycosyl hydrolase [Chloroflexia bacterium]